MKRKPRSGGAGMTRQPKGGDYVAVLIRIPRALERLTREAARLEGVSLASWWQEAGRGALMQTARALDMERLAPDEPTNPRGRR